MFDAQAWLHKSCVDCLCMLTFTQNLCKIVHKRPKSTENWLFKFVSFAHSKRSSWQDYDYVSACLEHGVGGGHARQASSDDDYLRHFGSFFFGWRRAKTLQTDGWVAEWGTRIGRRRVRVVLYRAQATCMSYLCEENITKYVDYNHTLVNKIWLEKHLMDCSLFTTSNFHEVVLQRAIKTELS